MEELEAARKRFKCRVTASTDRTLHGSDALRFGVLGGRGEMDET